MKISELRQQQPEEQLRILEEQPRMLFNDVLDNPDEFVGKMICFLETCSLSKQKLIVQKAVYMPEEKRWLLSNCDLSNGAEEFFNKMFTVCDIGRYFAHLCNQRGYILDLETTQAQVS